jgi:hypothetical protein
MSVLVARCEGEFVRAFPALPGTKVYGWHASFGLVSETAREDRVRAQRRKGAIVRAKDWRGRFQVEWRGATPHVTALEGCQVEKTADGWHVLSGGKAWTLHAAAGTSAIAIPVAHVERQDARKRDRLILLMAFALLFGAIVARVVWTPEETAPAAPVEAAEILPVEITIVKPQRPVVVPPSEGGSFGTNKVPGAHRAVHQNLGFLGLVGNKNLSKTVLGGATVNLKGTAGAGAGGDAGSGGEVLVGLGKGVRATTVGNSGVQGLGGVGTKGKGGGLGGYGDVDVASGEGAGISAIGVRPGGAGTGFGNGVGDGVGNGVGVNGGLDRHVINATIAKYLSQVRACYEDRLRINPALEGTLTMAFEIGASGKLNFSKVKSSSVADPQVGSCVSQRMMGWEFPKPRGGVNVAVTYPFALRPVGR